MATITLGTATRKVDNIIEIPATLQGTARARYLSVSNFNMTPSNTDLYDADYSILTTDTAGQYIIAIQVPLNSEGQLSIVPTGSIYNTATNMEDTLTGTPRSYRYDTREPVLEHYHIPGLIRNPFDVFLGYNVPVSGIHGENSAIDAYIYQGVNIGTPSVYYKNNFNGTWATLDRVVAPSLTYDNVVEDWVQADRDTEAQFFLIRFAQVPETAQGQFILSHRRPSPIRGPRGFDPVLQQSPGILGQQGGTPAPTIPSGGPFNWVVNEAVNQVIQLSGEITTVRVKGLYQRFWYTWNATTKQVRIGGTSTRLFSNQEFMIEAVGPGGTTTQGFNYNVIATELVIFQPPTTQITPGIEFNIPIRIDNDPSRIIVDGLWIGAYWENANDIPSADGNKRGIRIKGVMPADVILSVDDGQYTVEATNTANTVMITGMVTFGDPPPVPNAVAGISSSSAGTNMVSVSWSKPGNIETALILRYEYELGTFADESNWGETQDNGTSTSVTINTATYNRIRVRAVSAAGAGAWSELVVAYDYNVRNLRSSPFNNFRYRIEWDTPNIAPGESIWRYEIQCRRDSGDSWSSTIRTTSNSTTCTLNDDEYQVRVVLNGGFAGPWQFGTFTG